MKNKQTTINPFRDNGLVGGVIENFYNASTLKFWTKEFREKDNLKEVGKGIGKIGIILGAMITVGVLLGPIGWGAALIGSVAMGAITPKIASALGSKGIEKSSAHRQKDRLNNLTVKKIQEKKEGLEKTGSNKKKFGIGAIVAGVLITIFTGGATLPLLVGGLAIGSAALYSGIKDTKLAKNLEGINDKSTTDEIKRAGVKLGIVKAKDLQQENQAPELVKTQHTEQTSVKQDDIQLKNAIKALHQTMQQPLQKNDLENSEQNSQAKQQQKNQIKI